MGIRAGLVYSSPPSRLLIKPFGPALPAWELVLLDPAAGLTGGR